MRLKLLLPEVKPDQFTVPKECARKGCKGKRFYARQEVMKVIVDAKYKIVSAWRFECASCGCTFRLYVSYALLGYLFDLDGTNVGREINQRMVPALLSILPVLMQDELLSGHDEPPQIGGGRQIKTLKKLMEAHPEIKKVWIDATEQPIQRPSEKLARKQCYSGKQREHTIKSQLLTTKTLILHVSGNLPGSVSDSTVLAGSGIMHAIPEDVQVNLDRGYEGTEDRYPNNTETCSTQPSLDFV